MDSKAIRLHVENNDLEFIKNNLTNIHHILHCAVYNDNINIVKWLKDNNYINQKSAQKVLNYAVSGEMIRLLKESGADITKSKILFEKKSPETIKYALEEGVDPNLQDEFGNTALHIVCLHGYHEGVKILLEHGAKILKNKNDETCCDFVMKNNHSPNRRLKIIELF